MFTPMTENRLNGNNASQSLDAHGPSGGFRDNHERQMFFDAGKPKRYLAKAGAGATWRKKSSIARVTGSTGSI